MKNSLNTAMGESGICIVGPSGVGGTKLCITGQSKSTVQLVSTLDVERGDANCGGVRVAEVEVIELGA